MADIKRYLVLLLLLLGVGVAQGQESSTQGQESSTQGQKSSTRGQESSIHLVGRAAHNTTFGGYAATALTLNHTLSDSWAVVAGGQYSSFGRVAAEVRPSWRCEVESGTLSVEALGHYVAQGAVDNIALGLGVGLEGESWWVQCGYYARRYWLGGDSITEPFNLYYSFGVELLRGVEQWEASFAVTNSLPYELERHYQPSLVAAAKWHATPRVALTLDVAYKPTGVFHIAGGYYQSYTNLGICYKW